MRVDTNAALLTHLRRWPDLEGPDLPASDAADRLLLAEAAPTLTRVASVQAGGGAPGAVGFASTTPAEGEAFCAGVSGVVVIGDSYGGLTLPLLAREDSPARVRVHQDSLLSELALCANAERVRIDPARVVHHDLGPELLAGARVVLLRLPRSLAALEEIAQEVARYAAPDVHIVAAGRLKHMTLGMNTVLARSFGQVRASLAHQKSRVLHALDPRPGTLTYPMSRRIDELNLTVVAHGAAFAGASLDVGTRFLLTFLERMAPGARTAVDLGCGTGILAAMLARSRPELAVTAIDVSSAAVASTRETTARAGLGARVRVVRADGVSGLEPGSVDLVVCNPPFHAGGAVSPEVALRLLAPVRRVLAPGGELWTVYNSRLAHARALRRLVGPTQVWDSGPFTVARTVLA